MELPEPTKKESEVYAVIDRGYNKVDTAARAASRYLRDKLQELRQARIDDGVDPNEAGDLTKTFNPDEFAEQFWRYAQLTMDEELIKLLKLDEYRDQIMRLRIQEIFSSNGNKPKTKQVLLTPPAEKDGEPVYVGSDEQYAHISPRKKT